MSDDHRPASTRFLPVPPRAAWPAILLAAQLTACDVGRSVLAPFDATVPSDASPDVAVDVSPADVPGVDVPRADVPPADVPPADVPFDMPAADVPLDMPPADAPVDVPGGGYGCAEGLATCPPSCPELDVDCIRRCRFGVRPTSTANFDNVLACLTTACGASSHFTCFSTVAESLCGPQLMACFMDTFGTPPAPECPVAGESRCGGACVNTSFRDTANCGRCGNACMGGENCVFGQCVVRGTTNIALQWHAIGDVDLVVRTPCNDVVSAASPSACGAQFVRSSATFGPEVINFAATPMTGRYVVCAIPRVALTGATMPAARVLLDRAGMPLVAFPTPPMTVTDRTSFAGTVLSTTPSATEADCTAASPYHIADIDL